MNLLNTRHSSLRMRALGAVVAVTALAACGSDSKSTEVAPPVVAPKISVTFDASSPENELLASIYGQALENAGFRVARKNAMADRLTMFQAIVDNEVQLIIEHTDSLITLVHEQNGGEKPVSQGPAQQRAALQTSLPPTVVVGSPSSAVHNEVIACGEAANAEFPVTNYSSLAGIADQLTLGAPVGFETAEPLGLAALTETYGITFKAFVPLGADEFAKALDDKTIDCIVTDSYDPLITAKSLTLLDDDKFIVTTEAVIPLVSTTVGTPDVIAVLDSVSAKLSTIAVSQMLDEIAASGTAADVVAKAFLQAEQ